MHYLVREERYVLNAVRFTVYDDRKQHLCNIRCVQQGVFGAMKLMPYAIADLSGKMLALIRPGCAPGDSCLNAMYAIDRPGMPTAFVMNIFESGLGMRRSFAVKQPGGPALRVQGNVLTRRYQFKRDGATTAKARPKWLALLPTYRVETAEGEDSLLVISCVVLIHVHYTYSAVYIGKPRKQKT